MKILIKLKIPCRRMKETLFIITAKQKTIKYFRYTGLNVFRDVFLLFLLFYVVILLAMKCQCLISIFLYLFCVSLWSKLKILPGLEREKLQVVFFGLWCAKKTVSQCQRLLFQLLLSCLYCDECLSPAQSRTNTGAGRR